MVNARQFVEIRGERVELLLTPSLHKIANKRGWEIKATEDWAEIQSAYIKLFYCAMINAYEIKKFDDPEIKDFNYTLLDLEVWAAEHPKELGELVKAYIEIRYGKSLEELAREKQKEKEEEVKKKKNSLWSKITHRLKNS